MPTSLTRRHLLASAAVAAMPAAAIAAVEKAPFVPRPKAIVRLTMDPGLGLPVRAYNEGFRATTVIKKMFFDRETA
jgi:hypothetical protein